MIKNRPNSLKIVIVAREGLINLT